jgi:hypothetical protein
VLIAGSEHMPHAYRAHPLEDILPVGPVSDAGAVDPVGGYAFHVTEAGQDHHALMIGETNETTQLAWKFVNRFSPLHSLSSWRRPRPTARTLISAIPRGTLDIEGAIKNNAFLCWQPVGRGRIVYLSGPDTYRLRFLRGDRLHYRFWGQLLRWAIAADLSTGSEFVRIRTDKTRYESNEMVQVVVQLTAADGSPIVTDSVTAIVQGDDERSIPLTADSQIPGQYVGEVTNIPPGVYQISPGGQDVDRLLTDNEQEPAIASFTIKADLPVEMLDTRCDRALAQQIADATGGQVLPPTAVEEVLSLTNLDPMVAETIETRPLWLEWKYLWIVFGCLQTEWIIRKWKGLS